MNEFLSQTESFDNTYKNEKELKKFGRWTS